MKDQQLLGMSLLPISVLGVACNCTVVFVSFRIKSLSPSFALLVRTTAIAEGIHSSVFLFYLTPSIVLDLGVLKQYSYICGPILITTYDICLNVHFLIVLNRFLAVFAPLAYQKVFSTNSSCFLVLLAVGLSVCIMSTLFLILGCRFYYDYSLSMFYFSEQAICWDYSAFDERKLFTSAFVEMFVNLITIVKVHQNRKKVNRGQVSEVYKKKELDFLKQTLGQGILMFLFAIAFCYVAFLVENPIPAFFLTTFLWCLLHAVDGLLVLLFNSEIRTAVVGKKKPMLGSSVLVEIKNSRNN